MSLLGATVRNETPVWKVYAEVFGADDPLTLKARTFRRNLWHLDHLLRALYWHDAAGNALHYRGKGLPGLDELPPAVHSTMRAWAAGDFSLEARFSLQPMMGEPVADVCAALETMPKLLAAGLDEGDIRKLLYDGYSASELGRALDATDGVMEYALAIVSPDTPRAAPF